MRERTRNAIHTAWQKTFVILRPTFFYLVEYTTFRSITAVKQRRDCIVSGWVTIENFDHKRLAFRPDQGWVNVGSW